MHHHHEPVKFLDFKHPKWRTAAFLKIEKKQYLENFDEIEPDGLPLFCGDVNNNFWSRPRQDSALQDQNFCMVSGHFVKVSYKQCSKLIKVQ